MPESANLFARMDKGSLTSLSQPIESGVRLTGAQKDLLTNEKDLVLLENDSVD